MHAPYEMDEAAAAMRIDITTSVDGVILGSDDPCFDFVGLGEDLTESSDLRDTLPDGILHHSAIDDLSLGSEIVSCTDAFIPHVNGTDSSGPEYSASEDNRAKPPPKIGARFSKEAVSVLRRWIAANAKDPYPNEEQKQILQSQTSLTKTQVETWLANTRRRSKRYQTSHHRLDSPSSSTSPVGIPQRPGTPAVRNGQSNSTLLQRWYESPPDEEPAAAADIALAVALNQTEYQGSLGKPDWLSLHDEPDNVFRALGGSTAVSHSSRSSVSSGHSNESWRSSRRINQIRATRASRQKSRSHSRHSRLANSQGPNSRGNLTAPPNRFQCTFCTESFGSKHDWQRHENSLHLPRERWLCAPHGTRAVNENGTGVCCAFCGQADPDDVHIKQHNPEHCRERKFSRKDHLKQHLRLVHNTTLKDWLVVKWKAPPIQVRSRCGFCGIIMETWNFRVDHLADHFKVGHTMAQWKGDWGFDDEVSSMVQNAIPPYLIGTESNTPYPFTASQAPGETPTHAHELIQSELSWFLQTYNDPAKCMPDQERIQLEACRVIFAAESMMQEEINQQPSSSWLRDLITSRPDIVHEAKFGPVRSHAESALHVPKIHSKRSLFEDCPLEQQLQQHVESVWSSSRKILGDAELQFEACRIISSLNPSPLPPSLNIISSWLITMVGSSANWLVAFRRRVYGHLLALEQSAKSGPTTSMTNAPDSGSLSLVQKGATEMASQDAHINPLELLSLESCLPHPDTPEANSTDHVLFNNTNLNIDTGHSEELKANTNSSPHSHWVNTDHMFVNDANFHWWLSRELGRWVTATMSPNNPNCHKPSDEEIRHQARCIVYDDDDPWNPTSADNDEWLQRFKSDFNIIDNPLNSQLAR